MFWWKLVCNKKQKYYLILFFFKKKYIKILCLFFIQIIFFFWKIYILVQNILFSIRILFLNFLVIILFLSAKKLLMSWVCLELIFFSTLPFLLWKSHRIFEIFFYTLFQRIRRFFLLFGIFCSINSILCIAIIMKLGIFPFIFVYPFVCLQLPWFRIYLILGINKITAFFIFFTFGVSLVSLFYIIVLLTFFVGSIMIWVQSSKNKLKNLVAWSSIVKSSLLTLVAVIGIQEFFRYFLFYNLVFFILIAVCAYNNVESFLYLKQTISIIVVMLLFFFSGIPPFIVFFYKILIINNLMEKFYSFQFFVIILSLIVSCMGYVKILVSKFFSNSLFVWNKKTKFFLILFFFLIVCFFLLIFL